MKTVCALVYSSPDGKTGWRLVKPGDVPEWVKRPAVMGRLLAGEIAKENHVGLALPARLGLDLWYRAERVMPDAESKRIVAAREKRDRRMARNRRLVH